ncbi:MULTISPECIES: methionyl-tRNA formyltransferase [Mesoflavibacter]|uniref:Methionyl-tRNA formyltransferase n=1 Tax=Mesoflavibacter profundi TaxID=2708110 RepID=A0ABT4RZJ4_9FLAO|nr:MULTISPECIES: methionyl-tRNA formyltransferase [Mesoflavibacter]MDA0176935.1 methionyl-tRNA formyltransferase [Mesoflavibacter profundi]QIJ87850.1 Methionyl-tRNA formyltransferase [Mesoflavibacter sp. HG96]QIJ90578.1 Methionyl-tRNA formyltransferase [Mesoflavibacter sp. HG37]
MKDLKIVFMGTPDFAVATLKQIIENKFNVVGVITAPDKPAGRGRKLNESAVKKYAKEQGLHILQPTNLKDQSFLEELKSLNANLQIIVAFRMLPKVVWDMPKYGTFNLHASLLPNYRGAAPINWAIINGETTTGVSTFFIDEKIDTGEMILQKEVEINPKENAGSLHDKLMHIGSDLVIDTIKLIQEGQVKTIPQPEDATIKTAYKLNRDNCKIDWTKDIDQIYNQIRGLSPYPAAWSILENGDQKLDVKIYQTEKEIENHNLTIGSIIFDKSSIKVAVNKGFINIIEIKLPGKRLMDVKSLLNGFTLEENAKML